MLKLDNLSFAYGNKQIFNSLSLEFPKSSKTAVMSESGRGKSTLLRLISGLEKPSSGKILDKPKSISYLFQEDRLLPDSTVQENIMLAIQSHSKSEREIYQQKILSLLNTLGLGKELNSYPDSLSGGMSRRVSLARALIHPSELLLLDEPFSGLDIDNVYRTAECILDYLSGRTLIMSTHSETEAQLLGCSILRL